MKIGTLQTKNNIFLAPMAGVTDRPFRDECVRMGAGLVYSEMVSAKGLAYGNKHTRVLLASGDYPCGVQLFGSDPETIARQAAAPELEEFDLIDINMGCPARKITGNCEGSALMLRPGLAYAIIRETVAAVKKPVTVKLRAGYDEAHKNVTEIALLAQKAGAAAVTVHGRTKEQGYSGSADREIIAQVAHALDIPVIGNGDVTDGPSAEDMLSRGCAAVMVGRAAQGNPWIFEEISAYLEGHSYTPPTAEEKKEVILRHAQALCELKGEAAMRQMRRHLCSYTRGMKGAAALRGEMNSIETVEDVQRILEKFF